MIRSIVGKITGISSSSPSQSKMEQLSDDDSYVLVDSEDFSNIFTDSEQVSSAADELEEDEIESSDLDRTDMSSEPSHWVEDYEDEDGIDLMPFGTLASKTITSQQEGDLGNLFGFPEHIKHKEDMELKDVARDHVLPMLPAKSLLRFKTVSKDWDKWITSPFLAHKQSYLHQDISGYFFQSPYYHPSFMAFENSACGIPSPSLRFLPEDVSLRSACRGLLLCQGDGSLSENAYYVCNPLTRQWRELPPCNYHHCPEAAVLAFEPSELNFGVDFEVICACPMIDQPMVLFEIYSSKHRSWRCSDTICFELEDEVILDEGFYMKGCVYWETSSRQILAFDLKNEHCGVLPLPCTSTKKGVLTQMHGELCYIQVCDRYRNFRIDIYQGLNMGIKHSARVSLVEDPKAMVGQEYRVLPSVNSNIVMILYGSQVYAYHLKERKVEVVNRSMDNKYNAKYLPYVNSLVNLAPERNLL